MGRSQLQGTPWHYEYIDNKHGKKNSHNCAYNTGSRCSCNISINHNKKCVGEKYCSEFERCSFRRPEIYNSDKKNKPSNKKRANLTKKKYNPKITVERGDTIKVFAIDTDEYIEIHVTDLYNPFYLKSLNDIVLIKCEKYKITAIKKH